MSRARFRNVLLLAAWTVLVVATTAFLIASGWDDFRPGLGAFFVCASPGLLLGGFALWRTAEEERRAEERERETLPAGRHVVVHVFAFALAAREADDLAGAVEGLPAHRATAILARHLADAGASRHIAVVPGDDGVERVIDGAIHRVTRTFSREPRDYRGGPPAEATDGRDCLVVYVLAARHVTEPSPMPREPAVLAAWLEAVVPLRPEDTLHVAIARSSLAARAEVDAALASFDARPLASFDART